MRRALTFPTGRVALVLIDLQEEHRMDGRYLVEDYSTVLANAQAILSAARRTDARVLHAAYVRDFSVVPPRPLEPTGESGRPLFSERGEHTKICGEVAPAEGEHVFEKNDASCFSDESFGIAIDNAALEWLIVCGVWTEACVAQTVRDAVARGLRVALVKDACGSGTGAMHQSALIHLANRLFGGAVVSTQDAVSLIGGQSRDVWQLEGSTPLRFDTADLADVYQSL